MRFLVVHTHLYQPPRENPWSELIERQPSAAPFHDWNERVSDECYEELGGAAVLDDAGRAIALVNLFARLSFNVGPTLAAWLARHRPGVLADARAGFDAALERSGAPPALMQPWGHPIMPLCDPRERRLQLAWGRADYRRRFGRDPEGVWLPETAIDTPTLEDAAAAGLRYAIVAPEQIAAIRPPDGAWHRVDATSLPTDRAYRVRLPSGREFVLFAFHPGLSRGIAFGSLLASGQTLLDATAEALAATAEDGGFVLVAADGETFGHHQKGAQHALAEALIRAHLTGVARVTHLGEVLRAAPPTWEARIVEPSSWSCPHGVGRWERDCGCAAAARPEGWSWAWRAPLRHAARQLRDRVFSAIERRGDELFDDPWAALEQAGELQGELAPLGRLDELLARHGAPAAPPAERARAVRLIELVRQTLAAATSCGWFFDDIAGIEARQVIRHMARAADLAGSVFGLDLEHDLAALLDEAVSNRDGAVTGATLLRRALAGDAWRGPEAVGLVALRRLGQALDGTLPGGPSAETVGAFAVNEEQAVEPASAPAGATVRGAATWFHVRTLDEGRTAFEAGLDAPGERPWVALDGERADDLPGPLRELELALAARHAARELPAPSAATVARDAWIAREAARLGMPLPPPFGEALRGGARALLATVLRRPEEGGPAALEHLEAALATCRDAGLGPRDVDDLRPALARRLDRELAESVAARGAGTGQLEAILALALAVAGPAALRRVRRRLAGDAEGLPEDVRAALAEAAGMTLDALTPVDAPVRILREDIRDSLA
ncbi:MAG: DUF3536 domain-containing protein [Acidobacteria bacterium]|nr:MAG: DUF3536 domain-containing protein [Acidobacteriota bacterium]